MKKELSSLVVIVNLMVLHVGRTTEALPNRREDYQQKRSISPNIVSISNQLLKITKDMEIESATTVESRTESTFESDEFIPVTEETLMDTTTISDGIIEESQLNDTTPVDSVQTDVAIPVIISTVSSENSVSVDVTCRSKVTLPIRNAPFITYSTNCDFCHHDMYTVNCVPDSFTCGLLCAGDSKCTHFTYIAKPNGLGDCYLKNAPNSGGAWALSIQSSSSYVCGYVGKRAFINILHGLCLSTEINATFP
ncbi:hypothetical protein GHT06_010930 [Daphnia sinensis]|uniref:Chitin-binding type-2 domain-containing protein n=1 Tax=Daphnia sinensis TaxID=1820382 RepID=A0AAD5L1U9_9CRUS|nr:hypothetical protein GHT06_010930 [Daphnia sinensis]